jgi:hypothetical protein
MSRLWRHLLLSGVLVLSFAGSALAQAEKGDKEVLLNGDVTSSFGADASSATTTGNVTGGLGYYFTQEMELFGSVNLAMSRQATAGTSVDAGLGVSFRYNFATPGRKTVPYAGFEYSLNSLRNPTDSSFVQPNGGLKYYVRRNVAFDVNVSYGHALLSNASGSVIRESIGLVFGF